jgi:hypothetical protein
MVLSLLRHSVGWHEAFRELNLVITKSNGLRDQLRVDFADIITLQTPKTTSMRMSIADIRVDALG